MADTARDAGVQALKNDDARGAVEHLTRAVTENPNDAQAYAYLGTAYGKLKMPDKAAECLQQAVRLAPQAVQLRFNLGMALELAGKRAEAVDSYRQALALDGGYDRARQALARLGASADSPAAPAPSPAPAPPATTSMYGAVPNIYGPPPAAAATGKPKPPAPAPMTPPPAPGGPPAAGLGEFAMGGPPAAPPAGGPPPAAASPYGPPPNIYGPSPQKAAPAPPPPAPPGYIPPPPGPPPGYGPSGYAPPGGAGAPAAPAVEAPPGTVHCPCCSQFSRIGMICEFCSQPLPPPPKPVSAPPPVTEDAPERGVVATLQNPERELDRSAMQGNCYLAGMGMGLWWGLIGAVVIVLSSLLQLRNSEVGRFLPVLAAICLMFVAGGSLVYGIIGMIGGGSEEPENLCSNLGIGLGLLTGLTVVPMALSWMGMSPFGVGGLFGLFSCVWVTRQMAKALGANINEWQSTVCVVSSGSGVVMTSSMRR